MPKIGGQAMARQQNHAVFGFDGIDEEHNNKGGPRQCIMNKLVKSIRCTTKVCDVDPTGFLRGEPEAGERFFCVRCHRPRTH
eukprot:2567494-Amphidinium_carterae.1